MSNFFKFLSGFKDLTAKEPVNIPIKYIDNGDGSVSEQVVVTGTLNAITSPDKETSHVGFRCIQAFTGVSVGQIVICAPIIDVVNPATAPIFKWINIQSEQYITPPAADFENYLQYLGGQSLTLAQMQTLGLATAAKQPDLDNGKTPVIPKFANSGHLAITTSSSGATWVDFASQACVRVKLNNCSGTDIEVRQGGSGVGLILPPNAIVPFEGLSNTNQISVRRLDTTNVQVAVQLRWES